MFRKILSMDLIRKKINDKGYSSLSQKEKATLEDEQWDTPLFNSVQEVLTAQTEGAVRTHTRIDLRNPDYGKETRKGNSRKKIIRTTVGRVLFNTIWPNELGYFNDRALKGDLGDLILATYEEKGKEETVEVVDKLKDLGFRAATKAGISIGIVDMIIPKAKGDVVAEKVV